MMSSSPSLPPSVQRLFNTRYCFMAVLITVSFCSCVQCIVYTDGSLAVRWLTSDNDTHLNDTFEGVDCFVYDLRNDESAKTVQTGGDHIYDTDTLSLYSMIDMCIEIQSRPHYHELWKRSIFNILEGIYPGTKWCGPGNVAQNYTDLGSYNMTDSCCRDHDNDCTDSIVSGDTKYGITNVNRYTISDCECDARFRQCLQNVSTFTSRAVGTMFFNVAGIRCLGKKPYFRRGIEVGTYVELVPPEPYTQEARTKITSLGKVLSGEITLGSWLGGLFGRK